MNETVCFVFGSMDKFFKQSHSNKHFVITVYWHQLQQKSQYEYKSTGI